MFGLMRLLFRQERRYQYRSTTFILYPLITSYLTVMIYWFTSKALTGMADLNQTWYANSYFEFLILGELVLLLPIALGDSGIRAVRYLANEGMLEDSFLLPKGPLKPIFALSFSMLLPELLSFFMLAFHASFFFGYSLPWLTIVQIFGLVLAILPSIFALNLFGTGLFLRMGRGEGLMSQLNYVAGIFAGAYFPLSVLSEQVSQILVTYSPHAAVLDLSRKLSVGINVNYLEKFLVFLFFGALLCIAGLFFFKRSVEKLRQKKWPSFTHP
jgi:ABC-type polysaccharide/polyol phosphate export permease